MSENIFAQEWVECLEAHYMHVIRINDKVTEPSLSIVMHSAGFTDAQLAELRVRATMHIDDVGADFVPDLDVLETHDHDHSAPEVTETHIYNIPIELPPAPVESVAVETDMLTEPENLPQAAVEPALLEENEAIEPDVPLEIAPVSIEITPVEAELLTELDDEPEAELEAELIEEDEAPEEPEIEKPDPDAPQQLSLF